MTAFELLCKIVASEVMGEDTLSDIEKDLDEDILKELYSVAKEFDLVHLCGSALNKIKPDVNDGLLKLFYNEFTLAVFRCRRLDDELSQISDLFESEGVDHIPLKGSVLRGYYPERWMRTSCDIDILIKKEEINSAGALLVEKLGYKHICRTAHDVSFESETGVHLELHFTLLEDFSALADQSKILEGAFGRSILAEGKRHTLLMRDEDLYFYNLAHMAKHLLNGGCGVKPFIDLWILENKVDFDPHQRKNIVSNGGLGPFLRESRELMQIWFFGREGTEENSIFEKYILNGGVYGTAKNQAKVGVAVKRSKLAYILSRIFPSYKTMKSIYPSLEGRKILLPFYHVRRWCRVVFCGGLRKAKVQIVGGARLDKKESEEVALLLSSLGFYEENP